MNLEAHRSHLFGLCYRMTGCAADADDLVQQTFARALEASPEARGTLRPWLVAVAMNLARDLLRARKRRGYTGPWLPSPLPDELADGPIAHEPASSERRYDLLESVSFAFLLALEALTPTQRAVLLLRDVFDYSVRETGEALGISEPNVKTTHHRARAAMERYEKSPRAPSERAREALHAFLAALASNDVATLESLLRDDVRGVTDGGGAHYAALLPIVGRERVITFFQNVSRKRGTQPIAVDAVMLNGAPAVVVRYAPNNPREAPVVVLRVELDDVGRISEVQSVLAPRKLTALTSA